jgi:Uma2 family endonuclease
VSLPPVKDSDMTAATFEPPVATAPDDMLFEIVDGQVVEKPVGAYSTWLAFQLAAWLDAYVREHRLGIVVTEMVFILDAQRNLRRRPDVAFVSAERWPIGQPPPPEGDWDVIPDLAVEVLSPREETRHSLRKVNEYFRYGVKEVWLAAPEDRMVYLYRDAKSARILQADEELSTPLIPVWQTTVGEWLPVISAPAKPKPGSGSD